MADQKTIEERRRRARGAPAEEREGAPRLPRKAEGEACRARAAPRPPRTPQARSTARARPKVRQGVVVSAKPDKTITVRIDVTRRHRVYKKIVRTSSTLHVHDETQRRERGRPRARGRVAGRSAGSSAGAS